MLNSLFNHTYLTVVEWPPLSAILNAWRSTTKKIIKFLRYSRFMSIIKRIYHFVGAHQAQGIITYETQRYLYDILLLSIQWNIYWITEAVALKLIWNRAASAAHPPSLLSLQEGISYIIIFNWKTLNVFMEFCNW